MEYLIKSTVIISLFYICFLLFLKKETFFNQNRWYLLCGLIMALIFPLIIIPIHIVVEPQIVPNTAYIVNNAQPLNIPSEPKQILNLNTLLWSTYLIGLCMFLILFIMQFGSLIRLLLTNPKNKDGIYTYVIVSSKISPFSFFKWIVYNPQSFTEQELKLMLTHEKVHANQWHSMDILFTQLACAVFWFNPLIWLYRKSVRQNLEYIADFETQTKSESKKEYQHLLLKTSVGAQNISLSNNFYNSLIKERIVMLQKSRSNQKKQWRYLLMLPVLAGLLLSMNTEKVFIESEDYANKNALNSLNKNNKHIEIVFTKTTTDKELDNIKKELKSNGITMTIKRLKRNTNGDISAIDIDFKTETGSANYNITNEDGIKPFYFNMKDDGSFSVGTKKEEGIVIIKTLKLEDSTKNVFLYKDDEIIEIVEDTIHVVTGKPLHRSDSTKIVKGYYYNTKTSNDSIYTTKNHFEIDTTKAQSIIKEQSDYYYQNSPKTKIRTTKTVVYKPNAFTFDKIKTKAKSNPKPIILLDGKAIAYETMDENVNSDSIESVTVLKGENAINYYGEKGKNGVILVKTKNNASKSNKTTSKTTGPFRVEVSSVSYVDDDNPLKNSTLVFISKYTSDNVLQDYKNKLEKEGISVKYTKVKRNKNGEIIRIKITLKNNKGTETSASWKVSDGIPGIEFGETKGTLTARTSQKIHGLKKED